MNSSQNLFADLTELLPHWAHEHTESGIRVAVNNIGSKPGYRGQSLEEVRLNAMRSQTDGSCFQNSGLGPAKAVFAPAKPHSLPSSSQAPKLSLFSVPSTAAKAQNGVDKESTSSVYPQPTSTLFGPSLFTTSALSVANPNGEAAAKSLFPSSLQQKPRCSLFDRPVSLKNSEADASETEEAKDEKKTITIIPPASSEDDHGCKSCQGKALSADPSRLLETEFELSLNWGYIVAFLVFLMIISPEHNWILGLLVLALIWMKSNDHNKISLKLV